MYTVRTGPGRKCLTFGGSICTQLGLVRKHRAFQIHRNKTDEMELPEICSLNKSSVTVAATKQNR